MLHQFRIFLIVLIFHFVLSNFEDYDMDSITSDESCTGTAEAGTELNCYCYSQPETYFEYSICAPKKCPLNDDKYQSVHGRCFYFENEWLTFVDARENCKAKGGKLYEPKDVDEMNEIAKISGLPNWSWIGLRIIYKDAPLSWNLNDVNYVYDSNNQSINFDPPWLGYNGYGKRGLYHTCIRVLTSPANELNLGKFLDNQCNTTKVYSICEL